MKLKNLILAVLAGGALLVSCQQEKPVFGISADKDAIEIPQAGGSAQVQVTTAQAWTVKIPTDAQAWLKAEPASGTGNAAITFTAAANEGKDRKTGLKINAGMAGYVSVTVTQPGSQKPGDGKTAETAWSPSEARAWIMANLTDKQVTEEKYYIKGFIHKVQTTFAASGTYGNAVFFMSDDGQASSEDFEAYQVYYLEGKQWKSGQPDVQVGDEVIVYGPITLYGSTPETAGKGAAFIYSHLRNGEAPTPGGGGDDTDYSKAEAKTVAEFIAAADKNTYYKLTGKVSSFNASYCSFDLEDATGKIYVYSVLDSYKTEWSSKIKNGGTITIAGKYDYYSKTEKHEVVEAAILSFEGGSDTPVADDPKGTGTQADPFNSAAAIKCVKDNGDKETSADFYVKGKISSIKYTFSEQYGTATFDISEDGTTSSTQFTCYGIYFLENKAWVEGNTQIAVGDEVIACGKLTVYNGTYETSNKKAFIYSLNGKTSEAAGPSFGVKSNAISVAASATEATISVTGNVAWTASSSDVTLDVASGEGAKDIKASFAANTDTENAKTYKVTLATTADVATKTIEVTITQGKASSGGGETVTLTFPDENSANNQVSAYECEWTAIIGSYSWTIVNANNNKWGNDWNFIRMGRKNVESVASITLDQPLSGSVNKVVVTYKKVNAADKIKSTKLIVATDSAFSAGVQEIPVTVSAAGDVDYTVTTPTANCYYKLVFDFDAHSANGIVEVSKIVYSVE